MKTPDEQPDQPTYLRFYPQPIHKNLNNQNHSNDFNPKPLISKLEINFPQIKICESRKDLHENSLDNLPTDLHYLPFRTNPPHTKQNTQQPDFAYLTHNQHKPSLPTHQEYTAKRQRSPIRFNEYSYQETTKQDYSQNNTPSYHDFFKVPLHLNHPQFTSYNPFAPEPKDIENYSSKYNELTYRDPFAIETKTDYSSPKKHQKTTQQHSVSPVTSPQSKQRLIQQPIKQKGKMTLSQLLTDLQKKSENLYLIYGQNNEDYQKCLETIQKNQNSSLKKPSLIKQNQKDFQIKQTTFHLKSNTQKQPQPQYIYSKPSQESYDSWKEFESRKAFDLSKKYIESKAESSSNQNKPKFQTSQKPIIQKYTSRQYSENKTHEYLTYTPNKQKSPLNYDKPYESADKKLTELSQTIPISTKGIITTSKSMSKQSSILDKKKKVMFFNQIDQEKISNQTKAQKFIDHLKKFLNRLMLDYLKSSYFYETGVLSTESNIHTTSGRNAQELMGDRSKESNKETSFFQDYFEKKDKHPAEVIVCNMMGGGRNNTNSINHDSAVKKAKLQEILSPYSLLPIEQQLQSSYGLSALGKSQQKKPLPVIYRESDSFERQQQKTEKQGEEETDSKYREHVNTNESGKVEELLIYSVDKNFMKNNLAAKKNGNAIGRKEREIDLQRFAIGLDKIMEIMKYKLLTQARYAYLTLKFIDPHSTEKGAISSLKISQVDRCSRQASSKDAQVHQANGLMKRRQQKVDANGAIGQLADRGSPKTNDVHQPKNILQHYYKKSSPNSQTNEYASIIEERKVSPTRNRINSGYERANLDVMVLNNANEVKRSHFFQNRQKQSPKIMQNIYPQLLQSTPMKQSQFIPIVKTGQIAQAIHQDYYTKGSANIQQSKLSGQRSSRVLSSSLSKGAITHGATMYNNQQRISKESLLSMRQSQLPIYSPASTGNNFGHNLMQQPSVERRQSIDPIVRESQMIDPRMKQSLMGREVLGSGIQQPPIGYPAASSLKNSYMPQGYHQSQSPLHALRPLQPQQKQLDYYNSKGKISRSYSQTDFKHYYNHSQNAINTIRPGDPLKNQSQIPGTQQTMLGSHISYAPNHISNSRLPSSSIPNIPHSITQNGQTIANIPPPNSRTVRPMINPSTQKRRSHSVSSFIHGPSTLQGFHPMSNTPSMLKQLEGKQFIQFKHHNANQQQIGPTLRPNPQMNQFYHKPVNSHLQMNRPRVSKSMDQCMVRPSSFSGYNLGNSVAGMHQFQQGNLINNCVQKNPQVPQQFLLNQQPIRQIHKANNSGSKFVYPNAKLIPNSTKTLQKQVQVNSEYHMLNNNYNMGVMMKGANSSNGRGSRVKYEEENLIVRNEASNYQASISNAITMHQSPQHLKTHQISNQRVQSPMIAVKISTDNKDQFGACLIPKPKSPSLAIMQSKSKSPQILKPKALTSKNQQGRLNSYGQN